MDPDSDVSLPRSTMAQKIREAFPSEMRVAGATMDLLIECCTEFVQLVTSEANDICSKESKATMNPEQIIQALQQLEFPEFEAELLQLLEQFKQETRDIGKQKRERKKKKNDNSMTPEEAIALQQQLFNQAKAGTAPPVAADAETGDEGQPS
ncbi:hypothetical protein ABBQ38_008173 [Trebouxia sp. C0009 RCD-2024]